MHDGRLEPTAGAGRATHAAIFGFLFENLFGKGTIFILSFPFFLVNRICQSDGMRESFAVRARRAPAVGGTRFAE